VHGRVDDVKAEYSHDIVPIAPELAKELLSYWNRCYPTEEGWLFGNPATEEPYHQEETQKKHIRTAAKMTESKREAHNSVVQMVLKPKSAQPVPILPRKTTSYGLIVVFNGFGISPGSS
jgi:hypothetical protein